MPERGLVIRRARQEDIPAVAGLFDQYRSFYQQPSDPQLALRFISERFEHHQSTLLLACTASGDIIGFCQLYPSFCSVAAARILILYDLFVSPAARRCGAAKALLKAAAEEGAHAGAVRLDLATATDNYAAQALYESLGWQRDNGFYTYSLTLTES